VALASRRNTGRFLTDIAASEPLEICPARSARLAPALASARASERRSLHRSALTTPTQDWLQTTNVWNRQESTISHREAKPKKIIFRRHYNAGE